MSQQIPVNLLSDSDSDSYVHRRPSLQNDTVDLTTPPSFIHSKKKARTEVFSNPSNSTVFIIDDDPTPIKRHQSSMGPASSSTPSFVPETPFSDGALVKCSASKCSSTAMATEERIVAETPVSELLKSEVSIIKCTSGVLNFEPECSSYSNPKSAEIATEERVVADTPISELLKSEVSVVKCTSGVLNRQPECFFNSNHNSAETNGLICLESDNESESDGGFGAWKNDITVFASKLTASERDSKCLESSISLNTGTSTELQKKLFMGNADKAQTLDGCSRPSFSEDDTSMTYFHSDDEAGKLKPIDQMSQPNVGGCTKMKKKGDEAMKPKRISKEEKLRLMEEKKQQKEREKLLKAASKAEAAETKKRQKEMQKWEKGKYALKSIVAEIDHKVVETGSIGGHLLTRFAEKGLSYRIKSNPIERSIVWNMAIPEEIAETSLERVEISYVLIIYEAEEFCNLVVNGSLMEHIQNAQHRYPHHTICYLTNKLMAYINKREQAQYKNPAHYSGWKRPAIEEVLSKLATHYFRVHSRQCIDESELAEHVVGLTCSLASCQFRKRLTRLSVNANGNIIPKDCVDKNLIKKSSWLKALIAIPKVQPRFAIAIWKKYPTMKSLLSVYMDPTKSVHEKEFLLKDLIMEGLLGDDRRLGEVCSKRIYRILMAQRGSIQTDEVEHGADFFSQQSP